MLNAAARTPRPPAAAVTLMAASTRGNAGGGDGAAAAAAVGPPLAWQFEEHTNATIVQMCDDDCSRALRMRWYKRAEEEVLFIQTIRSGDRLLEQFQELREELQEFRGALQELRREVRDEFREWREELRGVRESTAARGSLPTVRPVPAQAAAAASSMDPSCSQLERWLLMYSSGG